MKKTTFCIIIPFPNKEIAYQVLEESGYTGRVKTMLVEDYLAEDLLSPSPNGEYGKRG